ncbi:MAG: ATP synthase F1 subunit gamma [Myxococcota bacterium]
MPSLRDIRKRIRSVKNTQKITKAMKMVSAAKLRRAQERLIAARPYANQLHDVVSHLAARVGDTEKYPLLRSHPHPRKVLLVVITSDRGLAGGFNSNVIRRAERFLWEEKSRYPDIRVAVIGRKARDYFKKGHPTMQEHVGVFESLTFARAKEIADAIADEYVREDLDAVFLAYNEFKSAISQNVLIEQLLPVVPAGGTLLSAGADVRGAQVAAGGTTALTAGVEHKYEPSQGEILDALLSRYFATQVFRALLESVASEHGARMSAMDNATKNAGEMVGSLTLTYNRARQAYITKELMEIIGGAEALK